MPEFEFTERDLSVLVRYEMLENRIIWNAVAFHQSQPAHSLGGSDPYSPTHSPVGLIQTAIVAALKVRFG
jgi:hypothetical protein